jgi:protein translocase SecG subunit
MAQFLAVLFLIICLLLIVVVLLQKGRGGGLGSAFGGGAGGGAFGTRTGDVFTWVTIVLTALFLVLAVVTNLAVRGTVDTGKVATPEFSPAAWPKNETSDRIPITIKVATRDATIRYTLNGREPTDKSMIYHKTAVNVKRGQTLKARAFRAGMASSETHRVLFDLPAPATAPATRPATETPASSPATKPAGKTPALAPAGK